MWRFVTLMATGLTVLGSTASHASVVVSSVDYGFGTTPKNAKFTVPNAAKVLTFDGANPTGISFSGGSVRNFSDGAGARPSTSLTTFDTSNYLAVNPGQDARVLSDRGYRRVSLYWGSIDAYNQVGLLDKSGKVFASYSGSDITNPANGNQVSGLTNREVTFQTDGTSSRIYGLDLKSSQPALEVDNISFVPAVPESGTWLMMIAGMGFIGGVMRSRRKTEIPLVPQIGA